MVPYGEIIPCLISSMASWAVPPTPTMCSLTGAFILWGFSQEMVQMHVSVPPPDIYTAPAMHWDPGTRPS